MANWLNIVGVVALEVCLFAGLVLAFDRFAPTRWVRERHNLALAGFILLPVLFVFASLPKTAEPVPASFISASESRMMAYKPSSPVAREQASVPVAMTDRAFEPAATQSATLPWLEIALASWVGGSMLMLIRLVQDMLQLNGLRARARSVRAPAGLRLSRDADIRRSDEIDAPMVAGLFHPAILLPEDFCFEGHAKCVLEHEIAHIRRHDAWTELFLRLTLSVFWWVLPLHALHRIVRRTRETLCDERAVDVTGTPTALAHALLDTATRVTRVPSLALSATASRSALSSRIDHLTSTDATPGRNPFMRIHFVLPALALVAYAATPQMGEAREKDQVIQVQQDADELKGGQRHIHVYRDGDFDFSELEARLEDMDFSELEARLEGLGAEIDAKMAEMDFTAFEARMEALGAEIEARIASKDFSEFEARIDAMDFATIEDRLNAEELALLKADMAAQVIELEIEKLAELAELEKMIELEVLSKLEGLKELEDLAKLSELAALKALKDMPRAPHAPKAPHPHEAVEPPEWERN
ncbi:MAG: hypothetical protein CMK09_11460 [Ponticaulis sp.]|nr:hypothetical protein [Ponticaulis sp.]|tara:strand:- start:4504 stop:6093 length:1590 start_codon:yes stop_codon:yes gene_type:complete